MEIKLTPGSLPADLREEASSQLKRSSVNVWTLVISLKQETSLRGVSLTFLAVSTPTRGAMNSGLMPLSMSGGMTVAVIALAAIWRQHDYDEGSHNSPGR